MRRILHILAVLALLSAISGCGRKARVIPMNTFSEIFADILIADEWVRSNEEYRRQADTTLFYDPILKRYGYSFEDYDSSVKYYLNDPMRFSKVFRRSATILKNRQKRYVDKQNEIKAYMRIWNQISSYVTLDFQGDSLLYRQYDSVLFWTLDSLTRDSVLHARFVIDSLFRDSLLRDSITRDSLVRDSLQRDSLLRVKRKKR